MEPIESAADLLSWIDSCVLGDLRTLVNGVDAYYASTSHVGPDGRPVGAANFLLIAGCFSAIEYFGYILNDGPTQELRALAFIQRFLVPINPRYSEVDALLWKCFRHGTVHRSWPKRIKVEDEPDSIATGAGAEDGDAHLGPDPGRSDDTFVVNGRQLLRDLERALDGGFGEWIRLNDGADVLQRANPEDFRIGRSDTAMKAQANKIRAWNRAKRNGPA